MYWDVVLNDGGSCTKRFGDCSRHVKLKRYKITKIAKLFPNRQFGLEIGFYRENTLVPLITYSTR